MNHSVCFQSYDTTDGFVTLLYWGELNAPK